MSVQTISQTSTILRQSIVRYWSIYVFGLLFLVAALVAYRFTSVPAAATPAADRARAPLVEATAQSMIDYLRAYRSVEPLPTAAMSLDPAQQSVLSYLRAHERLEQSRAPWYPAVQAVLDYLHAHSR